MQGRSKHFPPNEPVEKLAERMRDRGVSAVRVTTRDARLVGLLYQEDAECLSHKP